MSESEDPVWRDVPLAPLSEVERELVERAWAKARTMFLDEDNDKDDDDVA